MFIDFDFIIDLGFGIIKLTGVIMEFMTTELWFPGVGTFEVYEMLLGVGLIVVITAIIVKKVVPFL